MVLVTCPGRLALEVGDTPPDEVELVPVWPGWVVDVAPVDDAPVEETAADEAPVPVDEAPVDETLVEDAPVDETPDEAELELGPLEVQVALPQLWLQVCVGLLERLQLLLSEDEVTTEAELELPALEVQVVVLLQLWLCEEGCGLVEIPMLLAVALVVATDEVTLLLSVDELVLEGYPEGPRLDVGVGSVGFPVFVVECE